MEELARNDARLAPFVQPLKYVAEPQVFYHDKAANVRAERVDGVVHLYCMKDITAINRHPAITGTGGRGGTFGNDAPLIPLDIDGPEHKKWRQLLDPLFAPNQVSRLEDSVRQLASELIDDFAETGKADLTQQFCIPLPCLTFLRLIGAPVEDLDFFLDFKDGMIHPKGDSIDEINANMAQSGAKMLEYFTGFLAERRSNIGHRDDVISKLISSKVDGEPISEADLMNILILLMFAGLDTVTSTLTSMLAWLAQHPIERQRLVDDKALIPAAVEELMRFETPSPISMRYCDQQDIDLGGGLVIRKGEGIYAVAAAANLDPDVFDDPMTVDFERPRNRHIVFASGTHRCLGSHLARLELRLAVESLLDRIPDFSLHPGETPAYENIPLRIVSYLPVVFEPTVKTTAQVD